MLENPKINAKITQLITLIIVLFMGKIGFGQTLTHKKLDSLIFKTISNHGIPSMVVAIIKPDSIYYGIQGNTRIDTIQKVSLTDKYHIGSNTKAFTSFLAFQAIEAHKINLDTKFVDLYPNLKDVRKEYKEISLSDVLSHNARVRPYTQLREFEKLPKFRGTTSEKRYEFAFKTKTGKKRKIFKCWLCIGRYDVGKGI